MLGNVYNTTVSVETIFFKIATIFSIKIHDIVLNKFPEYLNY